MARLSVVIKEAKLTQWEESELFYTVRSNLLEPFVNGTQNFTNTGGTIGEHWPCEEWKRQCSALLSITI